MERLGCAVLRLAEEERLGCAVERLEEERLTLLCWRLWPDAGLDAVERCCDDEELRWTEPDCLCWVEGLPTDAEFLLEEGCLPTEAFEREEALGRDCTDAERDDDEREGAEYDREEEAEERETPPPPDEP